VRTNPRIAAFLAAAILLTGAQACRRGNDAAAPLELLNVSYDPTRELFAELNPMFATQWQQSGGRSVNISMSHGGSGRQTRAVIDGLPADVVTLATAADIDALHAVGQLVPADWQQRLPNASAPYYSTIVFLVRASNPKNIRDWGDLVRPDVEVITPNPRTSGGARWNYLAAWGYALAQFNGDEARATDFMRQLFARVPVLDTGARGASNSFTQNGLGDVLLTWENEAWLLLNDLGSDRFEIVVPPTSIRAEPPVAVVDRNADTRGTREVATAYLEWLYTPEAQAVIARHHYRPTDPGAAAATAASFPTVELFSIEELGGWSQVQPRHFESGGVFDSIQAEGAQ
jgi:sulfate transport system substrate-binding protein